MFLKPYQSGLSAGVVNRKTQVPTVTEHHFFRTNIVLTSMALIISKFLRMPYEFYLRENHKTKKFTLI